MSSQTTSMVFKNNILIPSYHADSNSFLLDHPRGAYTTMRTLKDNNKTALFQYEHHIKRLIKSSKTMKEEQSQQDNSGSKDPNSPYKFDLLDDYPTFFKTVKDLTVDNIKQFKNSNQSGAVEDHDLKITILLTWLNYNGERFDLYTHITHLPPRPTDPVLVDIRRGSRVEMKAKDSVWVEQRKSVTDNKTKNSNEVLLCEDDGNVREGSSSNFFVLKDDGVLYTANEGILQGTVQILLLENVVDQLSQKVTFGIPNLCDLTKWKEAFVTSTSRLILPIHSFVISPDCIQFVDKSATLDRNENGDHVYKLLPNEKHSPVSEVLNKTLTSHMMDMSECLD
ncbi:hypothetical protein AKO1_005930 [Acrasis kona]|uniref:Uncharacterized protein n=1 Tax=Acrasis kona TaxID=1008807 RepID=A0AAW2YM31_9EUKA